MSDHPEKAKVRPRIRKQTEVSQLINRLIKPLAAKRGVSLEIIANWQQIVGPEFSRLAFPSKVVFRKHSDNSFEGFLYLEVSSGRAALELSYCNELILEKIASFYGYRAIHKINIKQVPQKDQQSNKNSWQPPKIEEKILAEKSSETNKLIHSPILAEKLAELELLINSTSHKD